MKRVLAALLVATLTGGAFLGFKLAQPASGRITVTADIEQGPNLFAGGRVMVRGVQVGTITGVEPRPEGVRVTLEVDAAVPVPADVQLAVIPVTVISDRYVQLFPAYEDGPTLEHGDHIALARTTIPAELDDVLTELKGLLSALEPGPDERGPLARLITALNKALDGGADDLAGALEGSADVLGNLASSDQQITGLIRNLDRLFLAIANRASEIGLVNERFQLVAGSLLADQENLEGTIENIAFLSAQATQLVDESGENIGRSLGRLERVVGKLLEHRAALADGLKWSNVIAQTLGATDAAGKGLHAYSGRQPALPPEYSYRLDTRDTLTCERMQQVANSVVAVLPDADEIEIKRTLLSFIPDPYDEHLDFLLLQLVEYCVDLDEARSGFRGAARRLLLDIEEQVGTERLLGMLGRWMVEGVAP